MRRKVVFVFVLLLCALGTRVGTVHAQTFNFWNITNNDPVNAAVGEAQFSLEVTDGEQNPGHVVFIFRNEGPDPASITDVYFDDGTLTSLTELIDLDDPTDPLHPWFGMGDSGVDFSPGASPADLPGGDDPDLMSALPYPQSLFETSLGFSADSDPPPPSMGVEPGEWLGIEFSMNGGILDDVIAELQNFTLRVGIHVQAFENGGVDSESFMATPEPATVCLLGLGGLALLRRRRR